MLKLRVYEYAFGLTSTPKDEIFCSCKRRKFIGQNKVKIVNNKVKFLRFQVKKLVALVLRILCVHDSS